MNPTDSIAKMVNIPVRFKRVAEAFDDMARDGRTRICESSGSEHSEAVDDESLSDLVNSFLERGNDDEVFNVDFDEEENEKGNDSDDDQESSVNLQFGIEEDLISLLRIENDEYVKMKIHAEVEKAWLTLGGFGLSKRKLMALLRERGFDAGLCKSKWDKKGNCPPGVYEYIDVHVEGRRYIVELSLASEFEIARPTDHYTSLLHHFPTIFVGEIRKLKKIARLMCNSTKMSMKRGDIHVPPWRRLAYIQAKWIGPYRRTINEVPKVPKIDSNCDTKKSIGFMATLPAISSYCREDFAGSSGPRKVGNLAMAFATSPMLL